MLLLFILLKNTPSMDNGNTADEPSALGLHLHEIEAFRPIRHIERQVIGFSVLLIHQLSEHIIGFHVSHPFSLKAQALLRRIRIQLKCRGLVFVHLGGRIVHLQVELGRIVLERCRCGGAVNAAIIGIKTVIVVTLHIGCVVGVDSR